MILVVGGTGTLGKELVSLLLAGGDSVRVLTRDEARANDLRVSGVETIVGDMRDRGSVESAVHGCAKVVMAAHGFIGGRGNGPAEVDRDGNRQLIRAAVQAHVEHAILVSTRAAAADDSMSLNRMKYAAEQALMGSGLDWTIIRSVPFLETWRGIIGARVADRGRALVLGRGDNPVNFVSVSDVAALIDLALHDAGLRGRIIDAAGPENVTFTELARQLIAASGRPGRIDHIPLTALRLMAVLARPLFPAFARQAQAAVLMNTTDMAVDDWDAKRPD